jgi:hypothetical protein
VGHDQAAQVTLVDPVCEADDRAAYTVSWDIGGRIGK